MGWPESEERSVVLGKVLTMKKWLALLLLCSFVGSVASAQWVVYDYKVSIKRLNSLISTIKYSTDNYDQASNTSLVFDSYTTAIDTLYGYLMVSICAGCDEETGSGGSMPFDSAVLLVRRKSDKTKAIWRFEPEVSAALFGKGVTLRPEDDELAAFPTSLKKLNQMWVAVVFEFADNADDAPFGKYGDWPYGFLGHGSAEGIIEATGFGTAKLLSETSVSFCRPPTNTSCFVLDKMPQGRMVGFVFQKGVCTEVPMWDVCTLDLLSEGVMHGTWSIKLNNSLSTKVNNDYYPEDVLINKLGTGELIYGN